MVRIDDVIVKPVETEKTLSEEGKYTFLVHPKATKGDVRTAVKEFYGVDVDKINMTTVREKMKGGRGKEVTRRSAGKKAKVSLKDGQKLNFNDFK